MLGSHHVRGKYQCPLPVGPSQIPAFSGPATGPGSPSLRGPTFPKDLLALSDTTLECAQSYMGAESTCPHQRVHGVFCKAKFAGAPKAVRRAGGEPGLLGLLGGVVFLFAWPRITKPECVQASVVAMATSSTTSLCAAMSLKHLGREGKWEQQSREKRTRTLLCPRPHDWGGRDFPRLPPQPQKILQPRERPEPWGLAGRGQHSQLSLSQLHRATQTQPPAGFGGELE